MGTGRLAGRTAVVDGGGRGIGRAVKSLAGPIVPRWEGPRPCGNGLDVGPDPRRRPPHDRIRADFNRVPGMRPITSRERASRTRNRLDGNGFTDA